MGLFDKNREPIIIKETGTSKAQLQLLEAMLPTASAANRAQLEQDIKMLRYGVYGEDQILFELKNSHMPMYVLHDLYLENEGLTAQIDFLIITEKVNFIVECKNLMGDIEIDGSGTFIRTVNYNGVFKKESIYSPITQNKRHIELLKQIRKQAKTNFLTKAIFERYFDRLYRGVVVLANPKTVLDAKYAKKEISEQVIRVDQLIEHIRQVNALSKEEPSRQKDMEQLAQFFLSVHKENKGDYLSKYRKTADGKGFIAATDAIPREKLVQAAPAQIEAKPPQTCPLYNDIRNWRYHKAKQENIKPYFVFYNTTLDELVEKKPRTIEELRTIGGLGDIKCQKYGIDLLQIISSHI